MRLHLYVALFAMICATVGCHCCPLTDHYAYCIDEIGDHDLACDCWYFPRWDISRLGKPDFGGPFRRKFCSRCNDGCFQRESRCVVYQPSYPYVFPGYSVSAPEMITDNPETLPLPRAAD